MSQSYHHLQKTPLRSTNTTQPASAGLVVPISQATMGENIYAERSRVNDEAENLSTETGNPVLFSPGDGDGWSQEGQDELIPGFNGMVSEWSLWETPCHARHVSLNINIIYSAGSRNAARCVEPIPSDPKVYLRKYPARVLAAAANADPSRKSEESSRARS
jgi:hypothetical protein